MSGGKGLYWILIGPPDSTDWSILVLNACLHRNISMLNTFYLIYDLKSNGCYTLYSMVCFRVNGKLWLTLVCIVPYAIGSEVNYSDLYIIHSSRPLSSCSVLARLIIGSGGPVPRAKGEMLAAGRSLQPAPWRPHYAPPHSLLWIMLVTGFIDNCVIWATMPIFW